MARTALAVRHVAFEDVGVWRETLLGLGYDLAYLEAGVDHLGADSLLAADLVIVLGGPIGVYETDAYPFVGGEIAAVRRRLDERKHILGVCLGAQMMAAALGARVAPGPVKEIGWAPLTLTPAGQASVLAPLGTAPVLHWHGDNCELPARCERLASTTHCLVQAFARAPSQLALQFHIETEPARFENWLVGHTVELGKAGIDPRKLRQEARSLGPATRELGGKVLATWLDSLPA